MSLWDRVGSLYDRAAPSPRIAVLAIAAVVVAAMLYQTRGPSDRERVEAYCAYGAKSAAQWLGCVDHVTIEKVRAMATPAARFAHDGGTCHGSTFCATWQDCVETDRAHVGECVTARAMREAGPRSRDAYGDSAYGDSAYGDSAYGDSAYDP